jgi:hypothetical protein
VHERPHEALAANAKPRDEFAGLRKLPLVAALFRHVTVTYAGL